MQHTLRFIGCLFCAVVLNGTTVFSGTNLVTTSQYTSSLPPSGSYTAAGPGAAQLLINHPEQPWDHFVDPVNGRSPDAPMLQAQDLNQALGSASSAQRGIAISRIEGLGSNPLALDGLLQASHDSDPSIARSATWAIAQAQPEPQTLTGGSLLFFQQQQDKARVKVMTEDKSQDIPSSWWNDPVLKAQREQDFMRRVREAMGTIAQKWPDNQININDVRLGWYSDGPKWGCQAITDDSAATTTVCDDSKNSGKITILFNQDYWMLRRDAEWKVELRMMVMHEMFHANVDKATENKYTENVYYKMLDRWQARQALAAKDQAAGISPSPNEERYRYNPSKPAPANMPKDLYGQDSKAMLHKIAYALLMKEEIEASEFPLKNYDQIFPREAGDEAAYARATEVNEGSVTHYSILEIQYRDALSEQQQSDFTTLTDGHHVALLRK